MKRALVHLCLAAFSATLLAAQDISLTPDRFVPLPHFHPDAVVASDDAILLAEPRGRELLYQRVALDGTLLDPHLRSFTMPVVAVRPVEVTWNGSNWVVFWPGWESTWIAAIDRHGIVAPDPLEIPVANGAHPVSSHGESIFVFQNPLRLEAYRVRPSGSQHVSTELPYLAGYWGVARFDWGWSPIRRGPDGRSYFVELPDGEWSTVAVADPFPVFTPHPAGGGILWWTRTAGGAFYFSIVRMDGSWSDPVAVGSALEPGIGRVLTHEEGWTFVSNLDLRTLVSLDGEVTRRLQPERDGIPSTTPPGAVVAGTEVFASSGPAGYRLRFVRGGAVVGQTLAGADLVTQSWPRVADGPGMSLVVWVENGSEVRATRVLPDGRPLDGAGILLDTGAVPEVVFDGATFVAAWRGGSGVRAARISLTGVVLDEIPLQIAEGEGAIGRIQLATIGGGRSLVYWQTGAFETVSDQLRAIENGVPAPGTVPLPRSGNARKNATLAGAADRYLLAWDDRFSSFAPPPGRAAGDSAAYAQIFAADGTPLTAAMPLPRALSADRVIATGAGDGWVVSWWDFGRTPAVRVGREGAIEAIGEIVPDAVALTGASDGSVTEVTMDGVMTFAPSLRPRSWRGYAGVPSTWSYGQDLRSIRAATAGGTLLVVETEGRLFLRPARFALARADLAAVDAGGSRHASSERTVLVENRGPGVVPAFVAITGFAAQSSPNTERLYPWSPRVFTGGEILSGGAVALSLSVRRETAPSLWILPVAIDDDAANNHLPLADGRWRPVAAPTFDSSRIPSGPMSQ